jgi:hypothetical protein
VQQKAIAGLPFAGGCLWPGWTTFEFRLVDLSRACGASWVNCDARYWCCESHDAFDSVVRDLFGIAGHFNAQHCILYIQTWNGNGH